MSCRWLPISRSLRPQRTAVVGAPRVAPRGTDWRRRRGCNNSDLSLTGVLIETSVPMLVGSTFRGGSPEQRADGGEHRLEQRRILRVPVRSADLAGGSQCRLASGRQSPSGQCRERSHPAKAAQQRGRAPRLADGKRVEETDRQVVSVGVALNYRPLMVENESPSFAVPLATKGEGSASTSLNAGK